MNDPGGVFADFRLAAAENMRAAGRPVTDAELEELREQVRNRDPVCWLWPAPETCTFASDEVARDFLRYWHNGQCAACGSPGDLVQDHDHETGLVRGYLCRSCNGLEAGASDKTTWGKYRRRNPATILGISLRYYSPFTGYAEPAPPPMPIDDDHPAFEAARLLAP